jgi:hypothetical protein
MLTQSDRTWAWLADLVRIIAEVEADGPPPPRPARKRSRKLRPLWEE